MSGVSGFSSGFSAGLMFSTRGVRLAEAFPPWPGPVVPMVDAPGFINGQNAKSKKVELPEAPTEAVFGRKPKTC